MQAPKEIEKKEGADADLQEFMNEDDTTHNKYTSRTALSAIKTLARNHKTSFHAHAEITSELIKNGIMPKDQAKAREFKLLLDATAKRNQDQWDYVPCYNHTTGIVEKIQVRMGEVLQYVIAAIQDQSKFKRTTYKERLKKFFNWMQTIPEAECNTGRRHDLIVKMLHDDYEDIFIITECKSSIKILAQRFYEKKWVEILKENPEKGYRLLCEWIDGSVLCALKETPLLDEFFNDGAELQNYLVAFFEGNGFHVNFDESTDDSDLESSQEEDEKASKELASYIVVNVNARADLKFACPDEYKNDIGTLVAIWAQQKKLSADVKQRLDDCRRLEDVRAQGLDVYMLCTVLRAKSSSTLQILPLGEVEGKLVSCAREVYQKTTQLLEKSQDWVNLKQELESLNEHLSRAIDTAAMQPHSELIRDSLSILNAEKNILRFSALHKKITSCFIKNSLAIQDDQELLRWVTQHVETQGENHIVTLTPYTFNRVCWQALTTSPAEWPENFIRLLDMVVLPLIELARNDADESIDENNKSFIKHACHKDLEAQLRWLLWLAKNRESESEDMSNLIIPSLFVPCKLSGFRFKKISSLNALNRQLTVSTKRGGHWPGLPDGIDIDRMEFRGNEFHIDNLVQLLLRCPEADCFKILKKGWKFVTDAKDLLKVLQIFEVVDRHVILQMGRNLLRNVQDVVMILRFFPPVDRKALIVKYSHFIKSAEILAKMQGLILPADRFDVALNFTSLYDDFDSFFAVVLTIPLPDCMQLIQRYSKLINRFDHLKAVVEKYSQVPECAALAIQCSRVIAYDYEMARLLTLFPEESRMGLVDTYLSKPRTHTKFIDVLKLLLASEQGALLEKYDGLFSKFEDIISVKEFML